MHYRIAGLHRSVCAGVPWIVLGVFFLFALQPCRAETGDESLWTFRFDGMPIGDVLRELSQRANVEIFTNRPPQEKVVTKTYTDMSLARIIRDVFKDVSFALVWYYDEDGLDGIGVWFFDDDQGGYPGSLRSIGDRTPARPPSPRIPIQKRVPVRPSAEDTAWAEDEEVAEEGSDWEEEEAETGLGDGGDDEAAGMDEDAPSSEADEEDEEI